MPCSLNYTILQNYTANLKSSVGNCYIAASFTPGEILEKGKDFYLGDGKDYGNFTNWALTKDAKYSVQQAFTLQYGVGVLAFYYTDTIQAILQDLILTLV